MSPLSRALALSLLLAGCAKPSPKPAPPSAPPLAKSQALAMAQEACKTLKTSLKAALKAALPQGPENAVAACRQQAGLITSQVGGPNVVVGRTSHKLRNPNNTPPHWVEPLLNRYVSGETRADHVIIPLPNGHFGYVEPLWMGPVCLKCHGAPAPPVLAKLTQLYPKDRATGFKTGDFRGLITVEISPPD